MEIECLMYGNDCDIVRFTYHNRLDNAKFQLIYQHFLQQ